MLTILDDVVDAVWPAPQGANYGADVNVGCPWKRQPFKGVFRTSSLNSEDDVCLLAPWSQFFTYVSFGRVVTEKINHC